MTDRALLLQALEALKFGLHVGFDESSESQIKKSGKAFDQHSKAIAALRERLEQPDPLPTPPECQTEAEKNAYAFGWWKALETYRKIHNDLRAKGAITLDELKDELADRSLGEIK